MNELEMIQTDNGSFWARPGTSDRKAIEEVCEKGGYERRGFKIEPGERWLDLGANVGAFSVYAALRGANVIAFEPDPDSFELVRKNVQWNSASEAVTLLNAGAWSKEAELPFYRNSARGNHWRNSLVKEWKGGEMIRVRLVDVAEYIEKDICLKIDVEGAEYEILDRLFQSGLIYRVKKFVLEWSFDILPNIEMFLSTVNKLASTHELMGVSDKYLERLRPHEVWPPSWFPPCAKIFGQRYHSYLPGG